MYIETSYTFSQMTIPIYYGPECKHDQMGLYGKPMYYSVFHVLNTVKYAQHTSIYV